MVKLPDVDRFRISCEAEAVHVGAIIAQLTKMGLTNVHFELITDVRSFNRNAQHKTTAAELLTPWVAEHPTFTSKEAVKFGRENGREASAVYYALAQLVEAGTLKKLAGSNYARSDVKQIEHKPKRVAKGPPKTFAKRGEDVILSYARRNHGRFSTQKLIPIFEGEGRSRSSVYPSVNNLLTQKLAKRIGEAGSGEYLLTAKASKPAKKKPAPAKANGDGTHVEIANGDGTHVEIANG